MSAVIRVMRMSNFVTDYSESNLLLVGYRLRVFVLLFELLVLKRVNRNICVLNFVFLNFTARSGLKEEDL